MYSRQFLKWKSYGEIKKLDNRKFSIQKIIVIFSLLLILLSICFISMDKTIDGVIVDKGFTLQPGKPDVYYFELKKNEKKFSVDITEEIYDKYRIGDYFKK